MLGIEFLTRHSVQLDSSNDCVYINFPSAFVQFARTEVEVLTPDSDERTVRVLKRIQSMIRDAIVALVNRERSEYRPIGWQDIGFITPDNAT